METLKTVADLKRSLALGTKIEMTRYNNEKPSERIRGVGIVVKVQTNGVYIQRNGKNSFLDFPKATEFTPSVENAGHFEITSGGNYPITLEYRLLN